MQLAWENEHSMQYAGKTLREEEIWKTYVERKY